MVYEYPAGLLSYYKEVYEEVDDPCSDSIISWSPTSNKSFVIWDPKAFASYRGCRFLQHLSLLTLYGFKRVRRPGPQLEFRNSNFVRGKPERLMKMNKRGTDAIPKMNVADEAKAKEFSKCVDRFQRLSI